MSYFVEFFAANPYSDVKQNQVFEVETFHEATLKVLEIAGDDMTIEPVKSKEAGLIKSRPGFNVYHYFIWEM
jgi:hypothetical protein